jgi:hypothetical protein
MPLFLVMSSFVTEILDQACSNYGQQYTFFGPQTLLMNI